MIELRFLSGYLKDQTFLFESKTTTLGRDPGNDLSINSANISARHGRIERMGKAYYYTDLGSTNGSLIQRGKEQIFLHKTPPLISDLRDGDQIVLGAHPNTFTIQVSIRPDGVGTAQGAETILACMSMTDVPRVDQALQKDNHALLALYALTKEMQGLNDKKLLYEGLAESVFNMLPHASHLAILHWDNEAGEATPVYARERHGSATSSDFSFSRSIIRRVMRRKEALLFRDAPQELDGAKSIEVSQILSSICVPLLDQNGIRGLLQVDNRQSRNTMFEKRDLELLTIAASHAATVLGNIELFGKLKDTLKRLELMELVKCQMSKFVPSSVQRILEENPAAVPGKAEKRVTVLFLDICGYTKMSEAMGYQEVNHIVEHYFSRYLDRIYANNGDINETVGDGLMVIFQHELHAVDAVRTALQIQEETHAVNREEAGEHDPVYVNIGINTGEASVGVVRFEGYAGARWTYTASGTTTNRAARMAAHAENGQIIIGQCTRQELTAEFETEPLGGASLKNVSDPVQLFEVKGLSGTRPGG